ncbi:MAG: type II secretion system protein GspE, partial [Rhodospirillales bacterium]
MTVAYRDFTEVLKDQGDLADPDLARAREMADETGEPLHLVLSRLGIVAEDVVTRAVAESLGVPGADEADYPDQAILMDRLSVDFLQTCRVLPISEDDETVTVAMANPFDRETIRALELKLGKSVARRVAAPFQLNRRFARLFERARPPRAAAPAFAEAESADVERLREMASEVP